MHAINFGHTLYVTIAHNLSSCSSSLSIPLPLRCQQLPTSHLEHKAEVTEGRHGELQLNLYIKYLDPIRIVSHCFQMNLTTIVYSKAQQQRQ